MPQCDRVPTDMPLVTIDDDINMSNDELDRIIGVYTASIPRYEAMINFMQRQVQYGTMHRNARAFNERTRQDAPRIFREAWDVLWDQVRDQVITDARAALNREALNYVNTVLSQEDVLRIAAGIAVPQPDQPDPGHQGRFHAVSLSPESTPMIGQRAPASPPSIMLPEAVTAEGSIIAYAARAQPDDLQSDAGSENVAVNALINRDLGLPHVPAQVPPVKAPPAQPAQRAVEQPAVKAPPCQQTVQQAPQAPVVNRVVQVKDPPAARPSNMPAHPMAVHVNEAVPPPPPPLPAPINPVGSPPVVVVPKPMIKMPPAHIRDEAVLVERQRLESIQPVIVPPPVPRIILPQHGDHQQAVPQQPHYQQVTRAVTGPSPPPPQCCNKVPTWGPLSHNPVINQSGSSGSAHMSPVGLGQPDTCAAAAPSPWAAPTSTQWGIGGLNDAEMMKLAASTPYAGQQVQLSTAVYASAGHFNPKMCPTDDQLVRSVSRHYRKCREKSVGAAKRQREEAEKIESWVKRVKVAMTRSELPQYAGEENLRKAAREICQSHPNDEDIDIFVIAPILTRLLPKTMYQINSGSGGYAGYRPGHVQVSGLPTEPPLSEREIMEPMMTFNYVLLSGHTGISGINFGYKIDREDEADYYSFNGQVNLAFVHPWLACAFIKAFNGEVWGLSDKVVNVAYSTHYMGHVRPRPGQFSATREGARVWDFLPVPPQRPSLLIAFEREREAEEAASMAAAAAAAASSSAGPSTDPPSTPRNAVGVSLSVAPRGPLNRF